MTNNEKTRCTWAQNGIDIYKRYHDMEWGTPCYDEHTLIEMLILESFHAGLSWLIVLKKREDFRIAFDQFDMKKISQYDENKFNELMCNKKIIRNKLKIRATINNAQKILEIIKEWGSFTEYIWHFTDHEIIYNIDNQFKDKTALSDTIAKDMKKRGIKFLGSVTVYAYLQAVGIVNDHELKCYRHYGI
ncbi:MAG: DNA-3-methyladenine glycosylase I [Clostridiales bacterium]|nr:DNA-3-methyladenine glycosylase I [Clostridiales bacterium]